MKKTNQKGFSAVETVLVLVIVGLIAFIAWYVFKSSSDTNTTLSNASNTQTEVPKTSSEVVVVKTDTKGAKYLADGSNKALYTYSSDTDGVSNCTGDCLTAWPIYKAASTDNLPDNITVIKRADGSSQYAYKGMALYYYSADTTGKVTGNDVNGFIVAKP